MVRAGAARHSDLSEPPTALPLENTTGPPAKAAAFLSVCACACGGVCVCVMRVMRVTCAMRGVWRGRVSVLSCRCARRKVGRLLVLTFPPGRPQQGWPLFACDPDLRLFHSLPCVSYIAIW